MGFSEFADALMSNNIPEVTLAVGGILAIILTIFYLKKGRSAAYKLIMIISMVFGVYMAIVAYNTYGATGWAMSTSVLMMVASFTLIIRPFKEIHFAVLIALMTMGIAYVLLGGLSTASIEILRMLSEGWPRIGLAVLCGVLVYSLLHMLESIVKIAGKIMNAWPVLFVLGILCIIEAITAFMGHGSVYDFFTSL
ncbi:MAG: hypothetical protein FWD81_06135 [Methanomassiliicoccaceae archaeon]|nr:hypothetical protein [Methanomassiliicoccaceae archaeon]